MRKVGIEIEYGSVDEVDLWKLVCRAAKITHHDPLNYLFGDSSWEEDEVESHKWILKSECGGGVEISTPACLDLNLIKRGLRVLEGGLRGMGADCDPADWGLHVHVDIGELGTKPGPEQRASLFKLIANFSVWEKYFFQLQPPERFWSPWCRPINENLWESPDCSGESFAGFDEHENSMDFSSFEDLGTVEFRLGGSTIVADDVVNWADLCRRFTSEALQLSSPTKGGDFGKFMEFVKVPTRLKGWMISHRHLEKGSD